jgi:hypothetical protein
VADEDQAAQGPSLETRLAALEKGLKDRDDQIASLRRDNLMLASQPPARQEAPRAPQPAPQMDWTGLPDPSVEPGAYQAMVNQRVLAHQQAQRAYEQAQQPQDDGYSARLNGLWEEFQERYPGRDEDLVAVAAQKVRQRVQTRGMDPDAYMFRAPETFFQDVVAMMDQKGWAPKAQKQPEPDNFEEVTAGIFGGAQSGNRLVAQTEEKLGSFANSMNIWQEKADLYPRSSELKRAYGDK